MTAGQTWPGRRVQSMSEIVEPCDYFGPTTDYTGADVPAIFFLKPNARDVDAPSRARSIQHVCSPPHVFHENEDGSLTISPSIGQYVRDVPQTPDNSDGWHGYLEHGVWRQV